MDVREKLVYLVKNALRAYGKDLEKTVEPYEFIADFLIHSGVTVQVITPEQYEVEFGGDDEPVGNSDRLEDDKR